MFQYVYFGHLKTSVCSIAQFCSSLLDKFHEMNTGNKQKVLFFKDKNICSKVRPEKKD